MKFLFVQMSADTHLQVDNTLYLSGKDLKQVCVNREILK